MPYSSDPEITSGLDGALQGAGGVHPCWPRLSRRQTHRHGPQIVYTAALVFEEASLQGGAQACRDVAQREAQL